MITTVSRLALDALRSARVRREAYVGPWLPEPIVSTEPSPEERVTRAEDVSLALMVVLESLSANERAAFVLHDVFGYAFDELAQTLGVSAADRAPARLAGAQGGRGAPPALPGHAAAAARADHRLRPGALEGDMDRLLELLHPDVVFTSDGGGIVTAARKPLARRRPGRPRDRRRWPRRAASSTFQIVDVNGHARALLGIAPDGDPHRDRLHRRRRPDRRASTSSATPRSSGACHEDAAATRPGGRRRLALLPGLQATLAPQGFYGGFPLGRGWVELPPPYNEHLTRDVGAFYLAFALLFAWAAISLQRALIMPLAVAWSVFSALHAAFHVTHLDGFSTGDAIAQTAGLLAVIALPLLAVSWSRTPRTDTRARPPGPDHADRASAGPASRAS